MALSIDPQVAQWVSVGLSVAGVLATLAPSAFPDYIPPGAAKDIIQTAGLVTAISSGVHAMLHRYSSSEPGPGAPPDAPEVRAVALKVKRDEIDGQIQTLERLTPQLAPPRPYVGPYVGPRAS